jgi:hypothetical protein
MTVDPGPASENRRGAERQRRARGARREWKTVRAMVEMYCQHHHGGGSVCPDCHQLLVYVRRRLDKCPFGIDKPTCVKCPIHCYRATERERIREIMRWAGPRMLSRHPVLALWHLMRDRRDPPPRAERPRRSASEPSHRPISPRERSATEDAPTHRRDEPLPQAHPQPSTK